MIHEMSLLITRVEQFAGSLTSSFVGLVQPGYENTRPNRIRARRVVVEQSSPLYFYKKGTWSENRPSAPCPYYVEEHICSPKKIIPPQ